MKNINLEIVKEYMQAYNNFDIDNMISLFSENCIFEDISNSRGITKTNGKTELKNLAEQSKIYFSHREQKVINQIISDNKIALEIEYNATLVIDFPNGLKKGEKISMRGVSIYEFENSKIKRLADYS